MVLPIAIYSFVPPLVAVRGGGWWPRCHCHAHLAGLCQPQLGPSGPGHFHLSAHCRKLVYLYYSESLHTMLCVLTLRHRPAVTLSPARTLLEQRPLSPDVTASLPWSATDQFAT